MQQQSQSQQSQRFQLVSNEIPINLESGNQMPNQQNSQSTLLTTNHSLPISSSVISELTLTLAFEFITKRLLNDFVIGSFLLAAPGAPPMNQQALHGQAISQVQQPMAHMQASGNYT